MPGFLNAEKYYPLKMVIIEFSVIHRLDRPTSGVLIFAKNYETDLEVSLVIPRNTKQVFSDEHVERALISNYVVVPNVYIFIVFYSSSGP